MFDIRGPYHPREVAYFVAPPAPGPVVAERSNFAKSKPAFDAARRHVWYSDGNSGRYAVRPTNGVWPGGAPPRCVHRGSFVLRLLRQLRRAKVKVAPQRAKVRRRGVVVRIEGRTKDGERFARTRRFRACASR